MTFSNESDDSRGGTVGPSADSPIPTDDRRTQDDERDLPAAGEGGECLADAKAASDGNASARRGEGAEAVEGRNDGMAAEETSKISSAAPSGEGRGLEPEAAAGIGWNDSAHSITTPTQKPAGIEEPVRKWSESGVRPDRPRVATAPGAVLLSDSIGKEVAEKLGDDTSPQHEGDGRHEIAWAGGPEVAQTAPAPMDERATKELEGSALSFDAKVAPESSAMAATMPTVVDTSATDRSPRPEVVPVQDRLPVGQSSDFKPAKKDHCAKEAVVPRAVGTAISSCAAPSVEVFQSDDRLPPEHQSDVDCEKVGALEDAGVQKSASSDIRSANEISFLGGTNDDFTSPGAFRSTPGDPPVRSLPPPPRLPSENSRNRFNNIENAVGPTREDQGSAADLGVGYVVPTATYVVDEVVHADVVSQGTDSFEENFTSTKTVVLPWYSRKRWLFPLIAVVVAVAVLIALGATGTFGASSPSPGEILGNSNQSDSSDGGCAASEDAFQREALQFCGDENCWAQIGRDLEGPKPGAYFGGYVSFANEGSRFVVSIGDDDVLDDTDNLGIVQVYDIEPNGTFAQVGGDIAAWAPGNELRGFISKDGNRIAIGSPYYSGPDGKKDRVGQIRIFELQAGNWTMFGPPLDGVNKRDRYGYSVDINHDGSIFAVGATFADGRRGVIQVFQYNSKTGNETNSTWVQLGMDITSDAEYQEKTGWDIELSDDGFTIVVGGKTDDDTGESPGRLRVFKYVDGNWTQVGNDIEGEAGGDDFGRYVSMSSNGSTVAGGAWMNDGVNGTESGHVRVFSYDETGNWSQVGGDIDGEGPGDRLQRASLSSNGKRVAVHTGSTGNDSPGYVKVYDFIDGAWHQIGGTLRGQSYDGSFGAHAALSPDGSRLIVGSPDPKDAACFRGVVRAFDLRDV